MPIGTVKFFNTAKGYGFIGPEDGSKDVFVHISAVEEAGLSILTEGQKVEYEVVSKGPLQVGTIWQSMAALSPTRLRALTFRTNMATCSVSIPA